MKMKTKNVKREKPDPVARFLALSEAEKAMELAPFERGEVPLSRRRLRGHPPIGTGAKVISVSIEPRLLTAADAYAKRHNLTRSQVIARALQLVMQRRHV
jgi:hypothetical protein